MQLLFSSIKLSGLRKELLLSLPKAQLTHNSLTIFSMLPSTSSRSPSICSMLTVWSFLANANWTVLFRAVFVQLCSSRLFINWPCKVRRQCQVAQRLLHLSVEAALFISLSLVWMVWKRYLYKGHLWLAIQFCPEWEKGVLVVWKGKKHAFTFIPNPKMCVLICTLLGSHSLIIYRPGVAGAVL